VCALLGGSRSVRWLDAHRPRHKGCNPWLHLQVLQTLGQGRAGRTSLPSRSPRAEPLQLRTPARHQPLPGAAGQHLSAGNTVTVMFCIVQTRVWVHNLLDAAAFHAQQRQPGTMQCRWMSCSSIDACAPKTYLHY
jgi:hypothetical protein